MKKVFYLFLSSDSLQLVFQIPNEVSCESVLLLEEVKQAAFNRLIVETICPMKNYLIVGI